MSKATRTFYRVVTPSTFGNQTYLKTLKDAKEWIVDFGCNGGEKPEYWKEQSLLCKIEKVTEVSEFIPMKHQKRKNGYAVECEDANEPRDEWQLHAESGGC